MEYQEFKEHIRAFLTYLEVERNLSDHTLRAYQSDLQQFAHFWHSLDEHEQNILDVRQIIERFLVALFYRKIDKSSIARKFSCFRSLERFLTRFGINLNLKLSRPRLDKKLPVYLSVDEIFHLLDKIEPEKLPSKFPLRDTAILELLYATGIRCSELVNIILRDINLQERTIRIFGKGRKERIVLFGQRAYDRLTQYLKAERTIATDSTEPLFLNYKDEKLTSRSIQRIIKMFRSFLQIDRPITPHKIRHTFATHMLNQGADLRMVQELLGHQVLSSTEKYTHVSLEHLHAMCRDTHPMKDKN